MGDRIKWVVALTAACLFLAWGSAVGADRDRDMVLAAQVEPDDEEAARIREQDRKLRREREQLEERSREQAEAADRGAGSASDAAEKAAEDADSREVGRSGEYGGPARPDAAGHGESAARGRGDEVSAEMRERRDRRKETMEDYRESEEKVSGKKPWHKDSMDESEARDGGGDGLRQGAKGADESGGREDGDKGKGAKGKGGKSKSNN